MDFLEIFASGSYHSGIKILKILASNSELFRVYGIFTKLQTDADRGQPNTTNPAVYVFWLKKLRNDIKIALKPTGIKL